MKRNPFGKLFLLFIILFFCLPQLGISQVSEPGCDPFDPLCPIDGGLSLLIAAGIGLGARKAYQQRKKAGTGTI